jgi:predicted nucleic acid-binding protein
MSDSSIDTNVFSEIFKGNTPVQNFVENLDAVVDATVYIECVQGSKSNREKREVKNYLDNFSLILITERVSSRSIALIERYSNTYGLMLADAQIAAACLENDLTLVTCNMKDFQFIAGLKITAPPFPTV